MAEKELLTEFREYGKKMQLTAIFSIVETFLILFPLSIITFSFTLKALKHIKLAKGKLDNEALDTYYRKHLGAVIIRFIASIVIFFWLISLAFVIFIDNEMLYISFGFITLLGLALRTGAGIKERKAWKNFSQFFEEQSDFPLADKGIGASKKLKTAALMEALTIFALPLLIGWIFRAIGYFTLAKFKNILLSKESSPSAAIPVTAKKGTSPEITQVEKSYCPFCGAQIEPNTKECSNCGAPLKKKGK